MVEELSAREIFNESVLDALPVGIIVLDRHGYVVKYNDFEERLARRNRRDVIGRHFFEDVAVCTNVPEVAGQFREHVGSNTLATELDFAFELPFLPQPRDVHLRLRSFALNERIFAVIVVEDISLTKELERQRQRLLDVMVHDLRNPLQGILGYANLLKAASGEMEQEKVSQALESIEQGALRMDELLRGTLAEMRGERRTWQPMNLHALVLSTLGNLLPAARARDIAFEYGGELFFDPQFPDRAVRLVGAVDQLASLVQNLVSNAVKYADSKVRIDLVERDEEVAIEVEDDGRGIAADDQERIFDEGFQAADSLPGAGIGLYSVKRAAEAHGGEVVVRSSPGEGSLFTVTLPLG